MSTVLAQATAQQWPSCVFKKMEIKRKRGINTCLKINMYAAFEWLGVTTFNLKKRQEILNAYKKKKEKKKAHLC